MSKASSPSCGRTFLLIYRVFSIYRHGVGRFFQVFLKKHLLFPRRCGIMILLSWRCIEVVITRTTRNRLVGKTARGFESHHLRHHETAPQAVRAAWSAFLYPPRAASGRPDPKPEPRHSHEGRLSRPSPRRSPSGSLRHSQRLRRRPWRSHRPSCTHLLIGQSAGRSLLEDDLGDRQRDLGHSDHNCDSRLAHALTPLLLRCLYYSISRHDTQIQRRRICHSLFSIDGLGP